MNDDQALRDYLRTQFSDLDGAKLFMWRYVNEMGQLLPEFGCISTRSLAAHCSAVLENCAVASAGPDLTDYVRSEHGGALYFAAWGGKP